MGQTAKILGQNANCPLQNAKRKTSILAQRRLGEYIVHFIISR